MSVRTLKTASGLSPSVHHTGIWDPIKRRHEKVKREGDGGRRRGRVSGRVGNMSQIGTMNGTMSDEAGVGSSAGGKGGR